MVTVEHWHDFFPDVFISRMKSEFKENRNEVDLVPWLMLCFSFQLGKILSER